MAYTFKKFDLSNQRMYIYTKVETEETIQDMLKKYNIAMNDKGAKVKLLQQLLINYNQQKEKVYSDIQGWFKKLLQP